MSAISLLDLPYIPKIRILRFLENADLVKMKKTCRSMRILVSQNLVPRMAKWIFVNNRIRDDQEIVYVVQVVGSNPDKLFKMVYRRKKSDCDSPSFFSWFVEIFTKTCIPRFHFEGFDFTHEEVENIGKLWTEYEVTVGELSFQNAIFGVAENYSKIVSGMNPKKLVHNEEKVSDANSLLTDSFLKCMSSLDKFKVLPPRLGDVERHRQYKTLILATIPNQMDLIERLPSHCEVSTNFVLDFGLLKRELHHWWRHPKPFGFWAVSLPGQFRDGNLLIKELELPANAVDHAGSSKIFEIMSSDNHYRVYIKQSGYFKESDAAEWKFWESN